MKKLIFFTLTILLMNLAKGQTPTFYGDQALAHTYSIVAYDAQTGDMGVAVQSHWFSVGSLVLWGEAGVGVVATQSFVNPAFGPQGLTLLKTGLPPQAVVDAMLSADEGRAFRQLAVLNHEGKVAAFTGENCIEAAGHLVGKNYAVQANLMTNDKVWGAMAKAFEESDGQALAERMVAALAAAEAVGGDIRGKQSAAILVVRGQATGQSWKDRLVDLRIEDHPEPIVELQRLLKVHRAYEHMNKGDLAVEAGDIEAAMASYNSANALFPENEEMQFWTAVTMANFGKLEEALAIFKAVFAKNRNWHRLVPRLVKVKLLTVNEVDLEKILAL